jgi:hypothetical protein
LRLDNLFLALSLFMFWIFFANNIKRTTSFYDLAIIAHFFY